MLMKLHKNSADVNTNNFNNILKTTLTIHNNTSALSMKRYFIERADVFHTLKFD